MNYVSPSYDAAMRVCIADSCREGREPCTRKQCTAYHTDVAQVAPIKSSTPRFSDLPITMEADEGPGLFMSRLFWGLCVFNVIAWGGVAAWKWLS